MLKVIVLGSTGSLGIQTLEILEKYSEHFCVVGLSANSKKTLLDEQAKKFKVKKKVLVSRDGEKALKSLAALKEADIVVNVLSGFAGIKPSIAALKAGKVLILGNKESLFVEGKKIMKLLKAAGGNLIPLDSEHNSIFEIIQKVKAEASAKKLATPKIKKIILPCSGGPFYSKKKSFLSNVTVSAALAHPSWNMGKKISIESATLINKGLEIIEAHYLFQLPFLKIEVRIHPECQIHGVVEFIAAKSSEIYAYISPPNMGEHIENCLLRAAKLPIPKRNILKFNSLNKLAQKYNLYPSKPQPLPGIQLVLKTFNSAKGDSQKLKSFLIHEEKTIQLFLDGKIKFMNIFDLLC